MTTQPLRILLYSLLATSYSLLLGCNQTPSHIRHAVELYHAGNFPQAAAVMAPEAQKKDETFVLNSCRYGSCAFRGILKGSFLRYFCGLIPLP